MDKQAIILYNCISHLIILSDDSITNKIYLRIIHTRTGQRLVNEELSNDYKVKDLKRDIEHYKQIFNI